jgi:pyruvate-ferredoxin/flavodoxin oxidoreductase
MTLDSKQPDGSFQEFISGEIRYASLEKDFPDEAKKLHQTLERECMERYEVLKQMAGSNSSENIELT